MTIEELINKLREVQDQLEEVEAMNDTELWEAQDMLYQLIQDLEDTQTQTQVQAEWSEL